MKNEILKYILDIESVIQEIEEIKIKVGGNFKKFESNFILQRAVERELEIIGEAVNRLNKLNPAIQISSIPNIVALRNLIIHAYDSVEAELIWAIIQKDIPRLKEEISKIRNQ